MSFIPPDFIKEFLTGFVTNLWVGGASLLLGLAVGGLLAWLRFGGGIFGRIATGATSLFNATPTFVAMFVLLNLLPRSVTIAGYALTIPMATFVILSLGIYAASNISNGLLDTLRFLRAGSVRAAMLFIPNTTRVFVVLVLASSTGAAIGVPEAVTVTLRHAEILPDVTSRIMLVSLALVMFMLLVQALEAAVRTASGLLVRQWQ
jgi:ABC-type amino acid transport system permease subunit